jgi:hypothetical protein
LICDAGGIHSQAAKRSEHTLCRQSFNHHEQTILQAQLLIGGMTYYAGTLRKFDENHAATGSDPDAAIN